MSLCKDSITCPWLATVLGPQPDSLVFAGCGQHIAWSKKYCQFLQLSISPENFREWEMHTLHSGLVYEPFSSVLTKLLRRSTAPRSLMVNIHYKEYNSPFGFQAMLQTLPLWPKRTSSFFKIIWKFKYYILNTKTRCHVMTSIKYIKKWFQRQYNKFYITDLLRHNFKHISQFTLF